jgi:hypothetical protein
MSRDDETLRRRVLRYAKERGRKGEIDVESPLGAGIDGIVWKGLTTAIKAFYREHNYLAEKACYLRLRDRGAPESIAGFWVPILEGYDDFLMIIEMQLVSPPYVIDFGKAYLDQVPSRIPPVSREGIREAFEEKAPRVLHLLATLQGSYGIHYLDPRPGNIMFGDEWD